ncbi:centriolin protein [Herbaspirillum rubrisubalbicans M1]|uniref:hypothetical protein n=1 Tax=Herbaspirillum rubrisubalbicans TaxID=80842 RepID=UPI00073A3B54|nr:hypothetical protein [Herbaspirillum rubrisubalbicans]ALU90229.1 centriolin protein [Herbaspirillum rubrisubalbicans M1]
MKPISLPKQSAPDPAYLLPWTGTLAVFVMYVMINVWLYESVMKLIKQAANPFFVVLLVIVTVCGQLLTIWQTRHLLTEGKYLEWLIRRFKSAEGQDQSTKLANLNDSLHTGSAALEVRELFQQLLRKDGQPLTHDPVRLQHQADSFVLNIQRRTTLPQYIANTLIGLGLFGTFLGLIVTLKEVAALIGLFGVAGTEGSDMMAQFFQKMSGPLAGMGDAFVASLLGLGGSIVNNVQLLATKKLQRVLCVRAELAYMSTADAVCAPAQAQDGERQALQLAGDPAAGLAQLQEMRAIRSEMHQQTDAILLASSRMRQVSEPLTKWLESLEKRTAAQAMDRPQLEHIAATMEQRLGSLVHKFEETQQAHHGLLTSVRAMEVHLAGIAVGQTELSEDQKNASRKLGELLAATAQDAELSRQAMREHADSIRNGLGQDMRQVAELIDASLREQREHGLALSNIQGAASGTQVAVETVGAQLLQQGQQLQPQLIEIIARIDKLDISIVAKAQAQSQWAIPDLQAFAEKHVQDPLQQSPRLEGDPGAST